ncbi:MAG: CoA transferase [Dehalococcoidia bacterium]|nr:CoA transferase [Dehalococcoidia bacterium]
MSDAPAGRPFERYRALELGSQAAALCGRVLRDLGTEVVKVEPPQGDPMQRQAPLAGDDGIAFLWYNAGKARLTLNLEQPQAQRRVREALAGFDVLIDGNPPGWLAGHGLDPEELRRQYPHLIITSVTPFGQSGPYRDWTGTALTAWAMAGSLMRCGRPDEPPVGPPYQLAYHIGGVTAASATAAALYERGRSGEGDWLDCSVLEAVQVQADWSVPLYSVSGRATQRAGAGALFQLYRADDGWVRVINLSRKQWENLKRWLDSPREFQSDDWLNPLYRGAHLDVQKEVLERHFSGRSKVDLFREGQQYGVGIVPVYSPAEVMEDAHFKERGTFVTFPLPDGKTVRAPGTYVRMADREPQSPTAGASADPLADPLAGPPVRTSALGSNAGDGGDRGGGGDGGGGLMLEGVRIVEVGSGAVAPEITRVLGEFGADVIKLESKTQIDFMRLQGANLESSLGWASSNRSKRSVLVDLKSAAGREIGKALVRAADVVVENNTAGVMDRLGIDYEAARETNPDLIYVSSQAMGATGPYRSHGGFGPTNSAISSTSYLWNHPGAERPEGVQVIHPDHLLGRMGALVTFAALDERSRTGRGQHIDLSQAEFAIACLAEAFMESDLQGRTAEPAGNSSPIGAPHGVFACLGDDAWIAITIETDEQWSALKIVASIPEWEDARYDSTAGRLADRDLIEAQLMGFTAQFNHVALMRQLQVAGVPAGAAMTTPEVLADVHVAERGFYRTVLHPVIGPSRMEGVPWQAERMRLAGPVRAPLFGEHTDDVLAGWLGMGDGEIERARAAGALE